MSGRDVVVVGASAGGIEALLALVGGLPADLPAVLCVVVHVPPVGVSRLPAILSRAGPLPAIHPRQGEPLRPGRVYVAPPDRHLLVRDGLVELGRGPRENHSRPAVDPLFRSAARAYGPRVVGVVLSGALYDGAAGLAAVTARGGAAVVQDPEEAAFDGMPRSALRLVPSCRVLPAGAIGPALALLVREPVVETGGLPVVDEDERIARVIGQDFADQARDGRADELAVYTCPDCGGVLWQAAAGPAERFRCHVGHAYAPEALLAQKSEELEAALWACVRLLKEKVTLTRQSAARARLGSDSRGAERIEEQARLDERHAEVVRQLVEAIPNPGDQAATVIAALKGEVPADRVED